MAASLWEKKLKGGCENHDIWIRRLLDALFLALRNFANFRCSHGLSSGRCPGICIFISPSKLVCGIMDSSIVSIMRMSYLGWIVSISAWASTLLVQLHWAMRRPRFVGRVTGRIPRFFILPSAKSILIASWGFGGKVLEICKKIY